jgi:hypothetical protein
MTYAHCSCRCSGASGIHALSHRATSVRTTAPVACSPLARPSLGACQHGWAPHRNPLGGSLTLLVQFLRAAGRPPHCTQPRTAVMAAAPYPHPTQPHPTRPDPTSHDLTLCTETSWLLDTAPQRWQLLSASSGCCRTPMAHAVVRAVGKEALRAEGPLPLPPSNEHAASRPLPQALMP